MKAAGIIAEYNPFHNGHKYHIEKTREITSADVVVAVISSNFLQRGEPSIVSKWRRTEMALKNGVDLVLELPVVYSNQSAEIFALGSLAILDRVKADCIVFGSENGNIDEIIRIAEIQETRKNEIDEKIKEYMLTGLSYPNAINDAFYHITGYKDCFTPNNILGIEYVRAIKKIKSQIVPVTIKRHKAEYYSQDLIGNIASATAVRKHFMTGNRNSIKGVVPESVFEIMEEEYKNGNIVTMSQFYPYLRFALMSPKTYLKDIQDMEIGFEQRLIEAARKYRDFEIFFEAVRTKRYSNSRISRVLTHILLGLTTEITDKAKEKLPPYVRILGMNTVGRDYINKIKKTTEALLITNMKNIYDKVDEKTAEFLKIESRACELYGSFNGVKERKEPILIFENDEGGL